ncbi:hypothetical protein D9615_006045 [Tricholomella constricta]|uniref:Uncharacterized protein n=1 Tax=Tricholomella constricta TaxID=117010 RepID=A0A8H5M2R2_9AGAR|nr:hypothetical protein D9615_006045 [Tricholomella constricta]
MSSSSRSSSPTSSVSSHGLYVPVHKRSSGSFSSPRSFSSRASFSSESDSSISPPSQPAFIYSRDTLLNLALSPLSRLPLEVRESLRSQVPEIVTNRKQRKAIEYSNQRVGNASPATRRSPPAARSTERKRNAPQAVERVWRAPQLAVTPITV